MADGGGWAVSHRDIRELLERIHLHLGATTPPAIEPSSVKWSNNSGWKARDWQDDDMLKDYGAEMLVRHNEERLDLRSEITMALLRMDRETK